MTTAYRRKKQPDLVRHALLDCAARLALAEGVGAVTVQAVSEAAGVTKGGFFHHFASKRLLIEAMFAHLLDRIDADIDRRMAADPVRLGSFTRAYVQATFSDITRDPDGQWATVQISALADPEIRKLWTAWMIERLDRHRETDDEPVLETVRLAADGAWLAFLFRDDGGPVPDVPALRARLLAMTHGEGRET